jgi:hypothetical protein
MITHIFEPTKHVTSSKIIKWMLPRERLHREFKPAVIYPDGRKEWWLNGKRHRVGGPAVKHISNTFFIYEWWILGKLHRYNAPAVMTNKLEEWWYDGKLHRLDGPATKNFNKDRGTTYYQWINFGNLHRVDGPAVCDIVDIPDMTEEEIKVFVLKGYVKRYEWWYKNKKYSKEDYMKKIQEYKQEIKQDMIDANMNPIIASIISCYMTY